MKLALIGEAWHGGASRCIDDLVGAFGARHEIRVFPAKGGSPVAGLLPALTAYAPDIVHLHSFYGWLPYGMLRTLARRYPAAYTPHDPRPIGQIDPACYRCQRNRFCWNCPLVSRWRWLFAWKNPYFRQRLNRYRVHLLTPPNLQLVGVSQWLIGRLQQRETRRFRCWHIPNGVNVEFFRRREEARERLGLHPDAKVILYLAGRGLRWQLNPNKGLPELAEAFVQRIVPRHPGALLVVGGEWLAPNHPQVRGLGVVAREELPLWYSAASAYVLPSRGDNFPYTILEAMACECPVVASDVGGISEQVEPGVTGFLVPPNDPVALADSLERMLAQGAAARAMGRAARQRIERLFSLELFATRHEALYDFLLRAP